MDVKSQIEKRVLLKLKGENALKIRDVVDEIAGDSPERKLLVIKKILEMKSEGLINILDKPPLKAKNLSGYPTEIINLYESVNKLIEKIEEISAKTQVGASSPG